MKEWLLIRPLIVRGLSIRPHTQHFGCKKLHLASLTLKNFESKLSDCIVVPRGFKLIPPMLWRLFNFRRIMSCYATHILNYQFESIYKLDHYSLFYYNTSQVALYNTHSITLLYLRAPWTSVTPSSAKFSVIFSWSKGIPFKGCWETFLKKSGKVDLTRGKFAPFTSITPSLLLFGRANDQL